MVIYEIIGPVGRVEHIARHNVTPNEFEEVCFGHALVLRARAEGINPVYHALGQTVTGRQLLCVIIGCPDGKGYPVTARPMTAKESQRFQRWRNK
ncbi:MAG: hypothetical protein WCH61_03970 [bacterium]